jgi:probable DNA metabolism protein
MRSLIADELVVEVDELARYVLNECEHTKQFARFSLLAAGSLFAVFRPKADTIPLTAGYFAARMGGERFCIVDPVHRSAAFHDSGKLSGRKGHTVVRLDRESADQLLATKDLSPDELYVRALWKRFYDSVALPGRDASQRGYDLQAGWMPRRFWGGLTELDLRNDAKASTIPQRYTGKTLK